MTREEAISILVREKDEDPFMRTEHRDKIHKALEMAINVLGAIEQIQWERDAAIAQLKDLGYALGEKIEPCEDRSGTPLEEYCNSCEIGNPCLYCKHKFEEVEESEET